MRRLCTLLLFSLAITSCDAKKRPTPKETEPLRQPSVAIECPPDPVFGGIRMETAEVTFPEAPGAPTLQVELASTDEQRMRGLMYRTHMAENTGMLFLPDEPPKVQTFWMKNTCISLDMLFIDESGRIVGILEDVPPLNLEQRSVKKPSSYVLETNAGWTRKHGVATGQQVTLPNGSGYR